MTALSVADVLDLHGVTRLAHFTPAKNLTMILRDGQIRSSKDLADNAPDYFSPTDRLRFDQHPEHICCSLEYPNGYYLAQAQKKAEFRNYPDWVCLLLNRDLATRAGSLFAVCNAATASGAYVAEGPDALQACWSNPSVPGNWPRGPRHHAAVPTDVQAEVLVPGPISLSDVNAIVVPAEELADELSGLYDRLGYSAVVDFNWRVAPVLFDRDLLSHRVRFGGTIDETAWRPEEDETA